MFDQVLREELAKRAESAQSSTAGRSVVQPANVHNKLASTSPTTIPHGTLNTIFTDEAYQAARGRLRVKFGLDRGDERPDLAADLAAIASHWHVNAIDAHESDLAELIDARAVDDAVPQFADGIERCHLCQCNLTERGLFVDGSLRGQGGWVNMCARCFGRAGSGIGWGKGQLYSRQPDGKWRLVAGFRSST